MASSPEERFIVEEATLEKIQGWITEIAHETGVNIWHQPKHCIKRHVSKMTIDLYCFIPPKKYNLLTSMKSKTNSFNQPQWQRDRDWIFVVSPPIIYQNVCRVLFWGALGHQTGSRAHNQVACSMRESQKKATRWPALQETNHKAIRFAKSLPFLSLQRFAKSSPFEPLIWTL